MTSNSNLFFSSTYIKQTIKSPMLQLRSTRNLIRIDSSFMFVLHRSLLTMRVFFSRVSLFLSQRNTQRLLSVSRTCAFPGNKSQFQYIVWKYVCSISENFSSETGRSNGKQYISSSWFDGFTDELSRELYPIESLISPNDEKEYC